MTRVEYDGEWPYVPGWDEDELLALSGLVERSGATELEFGAMNMDAERIEDAGWYAHAKFQGARLTTATHRHPSGAVGELTMLLLRGAACRCGEPVTLSNRAPGCRWRRMGPKWEPGCTAPPIRVSGPRGDIAAMHAAYEQHYPNRSARRRAQRDKR